MSSSDEKSRSLSTKSNKKSLPRRCALIRRTQTADGLEKTELRFVTYTRAGEGPSKDEFGFFADIGQFLQEQIGQPEGTTRTTSATDVSSRRDTREEDLLRKAVPTLEKLVAYYEKRSNETGASAQYRVLKMTAKDVLTDVHKALTKRDRGGDVEELMKRIKLLNEIQMEGEVKKE